MIKRAVIQTGVTPSVVSGKPATHVNPQGEPLAKGEKVSSIKISKPTK